MDLNGPTIDQPAYRLANIARGDFDDSIDGRAEDLAACGKPVLLDFAHEMNGGWFPWGAGVNGNQPRRFHRRLAARPRPVRGTRRQQCALGVGAKRRL